MLITREFKEPADQLRGQNIMCHHFRQSLCQSIMPSRGQNIVYLCNRETYTPKNWNYSSAPDLAFCSHRNSNDRWMISKKFLRGTTIRGPTVADVVVTKQLVLNPDEMRVAVMTLHWYYCSYWCCTKPAGYSGLDAVTMTEADKVTEELIITGLFKGTFCEEIWW